jgi:hypothetical protein
MNSNRLEYESLTLLALFAPSGRKSIENHSEIRFDD